MYWYFWNWYQNYQRIANNQHWERVFRYGKNCFYVQDHVWLKYATIIQYLFSSACILHSLCKPTYVPWDKGNYRNRKWWIVDHVNCSMRKERVNLRGCDLKLILCGGVPDAPTIWAVDTAGHDIFWILDRVFTLDFVASHLRYSQRAVGLPPACCAQVTHESERGQDQT